jgi:hypothetical protein
MASHRISAALLALTLLCAGGATRALAVDDAVSDGVVKIGLLLDISSLHADIAGPVSEVAARKAGWRHDPV